MPQQHQRKTTSFAFTASLPIEFRGASSSPAMSVQYQPSEALSAEEARIPPSRTPLISGNLTIWRGGVPGEVLGAPSIPLAFANVFGAVHPS